MYANEYLSARAQLRNVVSIEDYRYLSLQPAPVPHNPRMHPQPGDLGLPPLPSLGYNHCVQACCRSVQVTRHVVIQIRLSGEQTLIFVVSLTIPIRDTG